MSGRRSESSASHCDRFFVILLILSITISVFSQTCYGKTGSLACGGHGSCISDDNCDCNTGYVGSKCSFKGCNDVLEANYLVCSGHGKCKDGDCTCRAGYGGEDCGNITCGGFLQQTDDVCTSRGVCTGPNLCNCDLYKESASMGKEYYHGSNCEFFECSKAEGSCKSIVVSDRAVSLTYEVNEEGSNPGMTFTYTLYSLFPNRRPSETVDCKNVFDWSGYKIVGKDAVCGWKSTTSHEFFVQFGSVHKFEGDPKLSVSLFPFESTYREFHVDIKKALTIELDLFEEIWNGIMAIMPGPMKTVMYQVLGFFWVYWYWMIIPVLLYCVIAGAGGFATLCCFCCDPKRVRRAMQKRKVKQVKGKIRLVDQMRKKNVMKKRQLLIKKQDDAMIRTDSHLDGAFDAIDGDVESQEQEMNEFGVYGGGD